MKTFKNKDLQKLYNEVYFGGPSLATQVRHLWRQYAPEGLAPDEVTPDEHEDIVQQIIKRLNTNEDDVRDAVFNLDDSSSMNVTMPQVSENSDRTFYVQKSKKLQATINFLNQALGVLEDISLMDSDTPLGPDNDVEQLKMTVERAVEHAEMIQSATQALT